MSYKFTISIDDEELDAITVRSLKEVYQDCIETINNPDSYKWEDVDDAMNRLKGASALLNYYMIPTDYLKYIKYWDNYIHTLTGTADEKDKDTGATD
jgi:hypothetical protein